ncbi:AAA family ATPase [Novosphingobium guangzhouense]|uniref:AAA family ATPase n=1 Tax=Novosphingobium guangzhouense TaxID=1850347 RepID=UPI000CCC40BD|nr:AAA family ATPase [Novosphingobium guangzhouense]
MPTLEINDFSCIQGARIELKPITLLIGPQASGKSLISKLCFFFTDILNQQFDAAESGLSLERFRNQMLKRFEEWFPPAAWGRKDFSIIYKSGEEITYSVNRSKKKKRNDYEIDIQFSAFFENQYNELLTQHQKRRSKVVVEDDDLFSSNYDNLWRVRSSAMKGLSERLGSDFIQTQTFIPAGRSFFTNLGKAVAMLEYGKQLDEITRGFGRLFTALLDGQNFWWSDKPDEKAKKFLTNQKARFDHLFGGKVKIAENDRHVATNDGRRISFSILSSGQQELFPLLLILQHKARLLATHGDKKSSEIIYVEEPEAHLFPAAQGELVDYIAALSSFLKGQCLFLITTHSPYVISKFNNLIKAHIVSAIYSEEVAKKVSSIVPEETWLPPATIGAYALSDGFLKSVNDRSGLIDGEYLDGISEDISETFLSLLEVETEYDRRRMSHAQKQIKDKIGGEW